MWVLKTNQPFDLRLNFRLLCVKNHIGDAESPQCETVSIIATVDTLDFLEGGVGLCLLRLEGLVVAWLHLGVGVVRGVSQLIGCLHWVPKPDCLIHASSHEQLTLG